ncbi:MAG TPA: universal stress protein [Dehalococcoidales bacterium]
MFERIVVPLDGSRLSAQALPCATELAHRFNSKIMLVRVIPETTVAYLPQPRSVGSALAVDIISEQVHIKDVENAANAKRYLMNRAKELRDQNINVSYHVMEGAPVPLIIEFSIEQDASLIVMMSHGRGRFKGAILGSVTDALIRGGSVPVLVIRARDMER